MKLIGMGGEKGNIVEEIWADMLNIQYIYMKMSLWRIHNYAQLYTQWKLKKIIISTEYDLG